MKKFFKALALVLALTLVIGTIPASAADEKVVEKKTLYVGGAKGTSTDGKLASKIGEKIAIYKLAGYDKDSQEGHTFEAVSADEKVVITGKTHVKAVGLGKTTVTIKVDGVEAGKVTVTAKKNASDETVTVTGLEENVVVGKTYTVLLPRKGVDSDERRLTIEGATVTEKADAPRQYEVVFPEEKEYTVVAEAFQSKKLDKATGTATCVVKAAKPAMQSVEQLSLTKFVVNFDTDVKGIYALTDLKPTDVSYDVAGTVVPYSILKSVSYTEDGKGMVVEVYLNFVSGKTYTVDFNGVQKSFVACGTELKDVAKVTVEADTAVYGTDADLKVKYYNAVGIEITNAVTGGILKLDLISGSDVAMVNAANKTIYFFESDKKAVVKATLVKGYDAENNYAEVAVASEPKEITSTKTPDDSYNDVVYMIDRTAAHASTEIGKNTWTTNKSICVDDGADDGVMSIFFKYTTADGKNVYYQTLADEKVTKVAASDENYVMVTGVDHAASTITLKGIKAAPSLQTIVLYKADAEGKDYGWKAVTVEVKAKRKLASATLAVSKDKVNTTSATADSFVVTITPRDQYQEVYDEVSAITYKQLQGSKDAVGTFTFPAAGVACSTVNNVFAIYNTITANDTAFADGAWQTSAKNAGYIGNIIFNAELTDNRDGNNKVSTNTVSFTIASKGAVAATFTGSLSAATLDTKVQGDTTTQTSAFSVAGTKDGFFTNTLAESTNYLFVPAVNAWDSVDTVLGAIRACTLGNIAGTLGVASQATIEAGDVRYFYTVVGPDGFLTADGDNVKKTGVTAVVNDGADHAVQAKTGTYTYTLYKAITNAKATNIVPVNTSTVRVTNTQVQATWKLIKDTTDNALATPGVDAAAAKAVINEVAEIYFNGENAGAPFLADSASGKVSDQKSIYIYEAKIKVGNATVGYLDLPVAINKLINGSNK